MRFIQIVLLSGFFFNSQFTLANITFEEPVTAKVYSFDGNKVILSRKNTKYKVPRKHFSKKKLSINDTVYINEKWLKSHKTYSIKTKK